MAEQQLRVRLRSFDGTLIDRSANDIAQIVKRSGSVISGPIPLPTELNRYTVLRSPHVNKKSREQFEIRTHKRIIDICNPSEDTISELTKLEIPGGVDIEISHIKRRKKVYPKNELNKKDNS